jgi:hypothetical protein
MNFTAVFEVFSRSYLVQKLSSIPTWLRLTLLFFMILLFLKPIFFTDDSYDYLQLSVIPKFASSHSMGLGLVFRIIAKLSDFTSPVFFTPFFLFWNAMGLGVICSFLYPISKKNRAVSKIIFILFFIFIVPGLLYISNALWSEPTNFFQIALFALLVRSTSRMPLYWLMPSVFILSAWSYQTRYSEIVLPIALLALAMLHGIKYFQASNSLRPVQYKKIRAYGILFLVSLFGIQSSNLLISKLYPHAQGQVYATNLVIAASIQCALRCDVKLFQIDCSTPNGKKLMESFRCGELIFGLKNLGSPTYDPYASPIKVFNRIGLRNSMYWLMKAPFTYLTDTHNIEMG